jgi:superfamily II DNA/RNA helicase
VLVFVLYKKEATDIGKMLVSRGFSAVALQGDMSQSARTRAMQAFRDGEASVLVATDVAARGLDVAAVSHVINFSFGLSVENYVHRVGRCGRAGRKGVATTFFVDGDEKFAPALLELRHRSAIAAGQKPPVPSQWLREMAAGAVAKEARQSGKAKKPLTVEEEEELERRLENRERQRQQQQQKKTRERAGQGGGGGGGGGRGGTKGDKGEKAWRKNKKKK